MPFRDDLEAATARRDALAHELSSIQARLIDHAPLHARVDELEAVLAEVTRRVAQARARASLPMLASAQIATPCNEPWDRMTGTDQVRFCGRCEKDVYNLSAMTAIAAEALLHERGADMCARFYRRPDGTVLTADCPVGARRRRRRRLVVTAVAVAAGALGVAWMLTERATDATTASIAMVAPAAGALDEDPDGVAYQPEVAPESTPDEVVPRREIPHMGGMKPRRSDE